jgi:hypothetical protein
MTHRSVALLFGDPFALALRHTEVGRALGQGAGPLPRVTACELQPWPKLACPARITAAHVHGDRPMTHLPQ